MSAVTVRAATAEDSQVVAALIGELLVLHDTPVPGDMAVALRRDGYGPNPCFEALLAEIDGAPVGVALFYPSYRPSIAASGLFLEDLYVRPEARRRGVAQALMAHVAALARDRGIAYVEWTVERANRAALAFYQRLGAAERGDTANYHIDGAALDRLADDC